MTQEESKAADNVAIARAAYEARVAKDRAAIKPLIAPDFHFTSRLDNSIDRATYFARCWPNSETLKRFDFINLVADRDRVFLTYEGRHTNGSVSAIPRSSRCAKTKSWMLKSISAGQYRTKRNPVASWKTVEVSDSKT